MRQFRFVHVGVAAALAAATVTAIGLAQSVGALGAGTASVFVPIVPCRLFDTRASADNNVGTRNTPIGPGEAATFAVWGANGNCIIPNIATGIATNATAVNPTAASYVTIYPADAVPRPTASNLNVVAGAPPTPNQVTVGLSAGGAIGVFNNGGRVDIIVDIVGYYVPSTSGSGPAGPAGPAGPKGDTGAAGSARAYGFVNGTSVTRSKNVVKVTNPQGGVFCVTLDPSISLATVVPTASPDFANDDTTASTGTMTYVEPRNISFICSASELEFESGYTVGNTGMNKNESFWFTVN